MLSRCHGGKSSWEEIAVRSQASWWFQISFIFIPIWGNDPIWRACFSDGLVQPPTSRISVETTLRFTTRLGRWHIVSTLAICLLGAMEVYLAFRTDSIIIHFTSKSWNLAIWHWVDTPSKESNRRSQGKILFFLETGRWVKEESFKDLTLYIGRVDLRWFGLASFSKPNPFDPSKSVEISEFFHPFTFLPPLFSTFDTNIQHHLPQTRDEQQKTEAGLFPMDFPKTSLHLHLQGVCMSLSYIDDLRSRSWVGFAEVAILAPELLMMKRRERSHLEALAGWARETTENPWGWEELPHLWWDNGRSVGNFLQKIGFGSSGLKIGKWHQVFLRRGMAMNTMDFFLKKWLVYTHLCVVYQLVGGLLGLGLSQSKQLELYIYIYFYKISFDSWLPDSIHKPFLWKKL